MDYPSIPIPVLTPINTGNTHQQSTKAGQEVPGDLVALLSHLNPAKVEEMIEAIAGKFRAEAKLADALAKKAEVETAIAEAKATADLKLLEALTDKAIAEQGKATEEGALAESARRKLDYEEDLSKKVRDTRTMKAVLREQVELKELRLRDKKVDAESRVLSRQGARPQPKPKNTTRPPGETPFNTGLRDQLKVVAPEADSAAPGNK